MEEAFSKKLTKFLTQKFFLKDEDLEKKIESPEWDDLFQNLQAIKDLLNPVTYEQMLKSSTKRQYITVVLPDDSNKDWVSLLKAAAYFPWEMDPSPLDFYCQFEEYILIQLAFAAHYGSRDAKYFLEISALQYANMTDFFNSGPLIERKYKGLSYYQLPIPDDVDLSCTLTDPKDFIEPGEDDGVRSTKLWRYLYQIAKKDGKRPPVKDYLN